MRRKSGKGMKAFKVTCGWILLLLAGWILGYALIFHAWIDKPFAAMIFFVTLLSGSGGALVLWSD